METILLCLAFLAYVAWRERSHAVERQALLSRRAGVSPPLASSRRRGKKGGARVLSADDDAAFNAVKGDEQPPEDGES